LILIASIVFSATKPPVIFLNISRLTTAVHRRVTSALEPGLPPWGPHVRFRRMQTLVREGSPLVKLRQFCLVPFRMRLGMRCRLSPTAEVPSHTSGAAIIFARPNILIQLVLNQHSHNAARAHRWQFLLDQKSQCRTSDLCRTSSHASPMCLYYRLANEGDSGGSVDQSTQNRWR
jgi:hypothetical protein